MHKILSSRGSMGSVSAWGGGREGEGTFKIVPLKSSFSCKSFLAIVNQAIYFEMLCYDLLK